MLFYFGKSPLVFSGISARSVVEKKTAQETLTLVGERRMGKRLRKKRKTGKKVFIIVLLLVAGSLGAYIWLKTAVYANLEDISKMRAEVLVSRTVNQALTAQFQEEKNPRQLFSVTKDPQGQIQMVQADSAEINIIMTQLSINLQKAFRNMEEEPLDVPIGALLGSKLLSQTGPMLKLYILPVSVISTDFMTEFESQGINQTKYKIYMILNCRVKVMAPFSSKDFDTKSTVLIAETVILGQVPDSFVQVPEQDILDVTD